MELRDQNLVEFVERKKTDVCKESIQKTCLSHDQCLTHSSDLDVVSYCVEICNIINEKQAELGGERMQMQRGDEIFQQIYQLLVTEQM